MPTMKSIFVFIFIRLKINLYTYNITAVMRESGTTPIHAGSNSSKINLWIYALVTGDSENIINRTIKLQTSDPPIK